MTAAVRTGGGGGIGVGVHGRHPQREMRLPHAPDRQEFSLVAPFSS